MEIFERYITVVYLYDIEVCESRYIGFRVRARNIVLLTVILIPHRDGGHIFQVNHLPWLFFSPEMPVEDHGLALAKW